MSASIYWHPVSHQSLNTGKDTASGVIGKLEKVFGFPCDLNEKHIEKLSTMAAMADSDNNPYQKLIDAIEEFGSIRVEASY